MVFLSIRLEEVNILRVRFKQIVTAIIFAVTSYAGIILAGPLLGSAGELGVPVAHAATTIDQTCGVYDTNEKASACRTGYNGRLSKLTQKIACQSFSGELVGPCQKGFNDARDDSATAATASGSANSNAPPNGTQNGVDSDKCAEAQGPPGWFLCPAFDKIANLFSDGAQNLITNFLEVQPLTFSGDIYKTWEAMRNLANIGFIFVFLMIIIANTTSMGGGVYSIKRMLPRLIAAVILVQASYLISALIIDFGNILGAGAGQLIHGALHGGSSTGYSLGALVENATAVAAAMIVLALVNWALAAPLALVLVLAALGFIATLAIRYLLIGVLIVVSPLAFAAMVLPNTEPYFAKWRSMLIRLVLMYPIIIVLLSVAGNVGGLIPLTANSGSVGGGLGQSLTVGVIKVLVFAGCFYAVTQTFKWAGGLMSEAYSRYSKFTGGQYKKAKEGGRYKELQEAHEAKRNARVRELEGKLGNVMGSNNAMVRAGGKGLFATGALLTAGRSVNKADRQRDESKVVTSAAKALGELKDADMMNQRKALLAFYGNPTQRAEAREYLREQGAESLLEYTNSLEQRQAMVRRLAENNLVGEEVATAIMNSGRESDFQMLLRENGKNIPKSTGLYGRYRRADDSQDNVLGTGKIRPGDVNGGLVKSVISTMTSKSFKQDFATDNLAVAAAGPTASDRQKDIAQQLSFVYGEGWDPRIMEQAFNANNQQDFAPIDKRTMLLLMFGRNKDQFMATDNGRELFNRAVNMFKRQQNTIQQDVVRRLEKEDDWADIKRELGL